MHSTQGLLTAWIALQFCAGYLQEILTLDGGLFTVVAETVVQYPSTTHWFVVKEATSATSFAQMTSTVTAIMTLSAVILRTVPQSGLPTVSSASSARTRIDILSASLGPSEISPESSNPTSTALISSLASVSVEYVTVVTVETISTLSTTLPASTSMAIANSIPTVITTQSAISSPPNSPTTSGPSLAAKVGIGVGVSLGTIALLVSSCFLRRRARQAKWTTETSRDQQDTVREEIPERIAEEMKHELHGSGGRHEISVQERAQELRGGRNAHELGA
ncbi:hypothetical protein MMC11_001799 [Xylographa trunciseda]|nr:hypothetical protein [Xylographa trunciseda]